MYAIATQPLIHRLHGIAKQVSYADDSAAGSNLEGLRRWWDVLEGIGPNYGYFPNGSKTFIVVKPELVETANEIFQGTGISISTEVRRYLGGAIGTTSFCNQLIDQKVTASLLTKVCHDVLIEPHLQPITGESMAHRTANTDDQSRLDIAASEFWGVGLKGHFLM